MKLMGRKKRKMKPKERKMFDMSYGRTLTLQCVIDKSHHSDAHGVYLEIDRKRQKQYRLISVHARILDVWKVALNGMTILESCNYSYSQTNDDLTKNFIRDLVETYGDYPSDDAEYQPCGNNLVLVPWLLSGGTMNDKHIPEGITFEVVKPPVTKKWKIYHRECKHPDYSQGMFAIGTSEMEVLMIKDTESVIISNAYILAAYLADFLNDTNHSERYLAQAELDRLYADAQTVFSVHLNTVDLN
jgi:hypothetical protein